MKRESNEWGQLVKMSKGSKDETIKIGLGRGNC
jgi:hypothetical protein